ncbi:MAG: glutamate--tRNA ligase [Gammaproteobacteria bacterium]
MTFRTRFAPSPTGYLHVGGARTALYCWLQSRKENGVYVLRIEDTDRERSTDEAVAAILESLEWLQIGGDEGPIFQTDRFDRYSEVVAKLLEQGNAYRCYCSQETLDQTREAQRAAGEKPRYNGLCRHRKDQPENEPYVIRFKTPQEGVTTFSDLVRGNLSFANAELDDLVIQRTDGTPTYNLTVVVDDADMNITHVIRGDDHINNTPRQINIFRALDLPLPVFAHVPMILGEDGSRLSKRHGAVGVMEFEKQGFLPDALLNYLIRLGWSHGDQEVFTREQMIELFDIKDVNRAASSFDMEKLRWINQQHMLASTPDYLATLARKELARRGFSVESDALLETVVQVFRERSHTIVELVDESQYIFMTAIELDEGAARKHLRPVVLEPMQYLLSVLSEVESWNSAEIEVQFNAVLEKFELKLPKLAQPVRVAVTGAASSPSISITLEMIGRENALARLGVAIEYLEKRKAGG